MYRQGPTDFDRFMPVAGQSAGESAVFATCFSGAPTAHESWSSLLFPTARHSNYGLLITHGVQSPSFSVAAVDRPIGSSLPVGSTRCFPRWIYSLDASGARPEEPDRAEHELIDGYRREDNITDSALSHFAKAFGESVTKDDVFHYVYAILHSRTYRERFSTELATALPRIPMAENQRDFGTFVKAGLELMALHTDCEEDELFEARILGSISELPLGVAPEPNAPPKSPDDDDAWLWRLVGDFTIPDDIDRDEWMDWFAALPAHQARFHRDEIMVSGLKAGLTLEEVGNLYGLTRERVRQIAKKHGVFIKDLRKLQKEQAERHYRRTAWHIFATSLTFPELEIAEIADMWETDEATVRKALEHRLAVHEAYTKTERGGIPDDELLAAVAEWGATAPKITTQAYSTWARERGIPGNQTVQNRFGSWNSALLRAGLGEHVQDRGGLRPHVSDETLWASIYGFFREELDSYTAQAYDDYARERELASLATLRNRLGTWNDMKQRVRALLRYAADRDGTWPWADRILDIVPGEVPRRLSTQEECLRALRRVGERTKGVLTVQAYEAARAPGDPTPPVVMQRCGSWVRAMVKAGLEDRLSGKGRGRLDRGEVAV